MKIAFVLSEFPSVSETFVLNQITGMIDRGHQVHIYAGRPKKLGALHPDIWKYELLERTFYYREIPAKWRLTKSALVFSGIFLKRPLFFLHAPWAIITNRKILGLGTLYKISPFIGNGPYDIILCHFGPNGNIGILLKKAGFKGKLAVAFHGYDMSNFLTLKGRNSYKYLSANGDLFMPISETWRRELISLGFDKRKILVHRMGVDVNKFSFRPRVGVNGRKVQILSVSRLVEKKGLDDAILAVAMAIKGGANVQYDIVGDGPLMPELQTLVQLQNINGEIRFLGWKNQEEVRRLMDQADIYLAPSKTSRDGGKEGIPVAMMEALAMGIPVISTFHSGIPELVEYGKSGFLVEEADVDALSTEIGNLLENHSMWTQLGLAGRKQVENKFNIDKLNDKLESIFQNLIRSNSK